MELIPSMTESKAANGNIDTVLYSGFWSNLDQFSSKHKVNFIYLRIV